MRWLQAHRDVKPENILLASKNDDTTVKLCDFGCAKTVTGQYSLKTMAGSPEYAAPEVYEHTINRGYGEQCDLWSAGVVVYVLLAGCPPFEGSVFEMAELICKGDWDFPEKYWEDVSQGPKDLIKALMTVDPEKRYTADQALACKWIQRPELQRSLSDKGLGITQSSRMSTVEDQLSQSVRDWNFHLDGSFISPVPMQWITESPRVLKVKREHPDTLRRFAKPKLGSILKDDDMQEDSIANISFHDSESPSVSESRSISSHQSHHLSTFKLQCSIPDLFNDADSTGKNL
jgi:serine/threonine protein kinase